jgi:ABC-type spermidine/putrescine transport system permease subunit II
MTTVARQRRDPLTGALAVITVIVLVFLFLPIGFVVAHSFNEGNNFNIWTGGPSGTWWSDVFHGDRALTTVAILAVLVIVGVGIPRLLRARGRPLPPLAERLVAPAMLVIGILVTGLTSNWYKELFHNEALGDVIRNAFFAALGGTVIAVVLGAFAGVALARRSGSWTAPFLGVIFLLLVTPEIMDALALRTWITYVGGPFDGEFLGLNAGFLRLWVGQSLYASAVVTLIVRARLFGIEESLEEAASDLGAPPARAFRQITLPLIASALIAGGLLSFTLCLDNTIISSAIATRGSTTFPVYVFSQRSSTVRPFIGVGAVVLMVITVISLAAVGLVLRRSGESSRDIAATLGGA